MCVRLTGCVGSSLLAVGIFAFNKLTWNWSVSAEVFGLNNLFAAMLMAQVVDIDLLPPEHYTQVPKVRLSALWSLVSSLSLDFRLLVLDLGTVSVLEMQTLCYY